MAELCTCGTRLVEDARFCHRCGRPSGGIDVMIPEEPHPATSAPVGPSPLPIPSPAGPLQVNLSNPAAIRVALIVSLLTVLASIMPFFNLLFLFWWIAGGWFSVRLYRKITGSQMTVNAGARLGWITGLLTFVGLSVFVTIAFVFGGRELIDELVSKNPQLALAMKDPAAIVFAVILTLLTFFLIISSAFAAGGALSARFSAKKLNI